MNKINKRKLKKEIDALERLVEFWDDMAETGHSQKQDSIKYQLIQHDYLKCPCCELARGRNSTLSNCDSCLLFSFWKENLYDEASNTNIFGRYFCEDSAYKGWRQAGAITTRKKYAKMIAKAGKVELNKRLEIQNGNNISK